MTSPWLKKNPFMSLWLSTAHRMAGSTRNAATAQVKQQVSAALADATDENVKRWSAVVAPSPTRSRPKRKG